MAKWQVKRFSNPCFLPTLSVVLLCLLPNHPFSNSDFSGQGQPIFLKFHFAYSKCSKFNNWPTFSKNITDLIQFRPHQTLCYFLAFWVPWPQPRDLYIWGWNSVISVRRAGYHTSFERACSELSYEPKYSKHSPAVTCLLMHFTSIW